MLVVLILNARRMSRSRALMLNLLLKVRVPLVLNLIYMNMQHTTPYAVSLPFLMKIYSIPLVRLQ